MITLAIFLSLSAAFAEEHTVDDQDGAPGFTTTGDDWATWGMSGYGYDGGDTSYHYLSHTVGGDDRRGTATWEATLSQAGTWRMETWFRRTENRTTDADFVVTDGLGSQHWSSINQEGDGASGWVSLGEYWCDSGFGGCSVTLDGTDDDSSDEANAVKYTLISTDTEPEDPDACDEEASPGAYSVRFYAQSASGSDWESSSNATGEADGGEAHSENVDAGEILKATSFNVCDPDGEETIDKVQLSVNARTQYDSGTYALDLLLDASGATSAVFTGTSSTWHTIDITSDKAWTWNTLEALVARVSLHDHPGGARDSDAWVDSFRLTVGYTTLATEDTGDTGDIDTGEEDTGDADDTADTDDTDDTDEDTSEPDTDFDSDVDGEDTEKEEPGCSSSGLGANPLWLLGLALIYRRRSKR